MFERVDYDPFERLAPVDHDPFFGTPAPSDFAQAKFNKIADAIVGGFRHWVETPGKLLRSEPETETGPMTEEEAFRLNMARNNAAQWGAGTAFGMLGVGTPAAMMGKKGTVGTFGGKLAKTADLDKLAQAEKMEKAGAYADDIWTETGWLRGADKKWRFEIPDQASKWKSNPQELLGSTRINKMGDIFEHPELYKAYPDLATKLDLDVTRPLNTTHRGSYQPGHPELGMSPSVTLHPRSLDVMRSTNLHELQHGIQDIEGFATGGNTIALKPGTGAWHIYQERLKAIKTPTPEAELKKAGVLSDDYTYADYLREHKQSLKEDNLGLDRAAQEYAVQEGYKRLAGEVEARNVQHRADWDTQRRQDIPPEFSEDVSRGNQFVRFRDATLGSGSRDPAQTAAGTVMQASRDQGIRAYHGSPHDFDKFDLSKIGTGEGAQAYGHGLYFAESEPVARSYRDALTRDSGKVELKTQFRHGILDDSPRTHERFVAARIRENRGDVAAAIRQLEGDAAKFPDDKTVRQALDFARTEGAQFNVKDFNPGRMYEVSLNARPEQFLDWDRPLAEQSGAVRAAMKDAKLGQKFHQDPLYKYPPTGAGLYRSLSNNVVRGGPSTETASTLREAGIPGIRYLDQGSRDPLKMKELAADLNQYREAAKHWAATGNEQKLKVAQGQIDALEKRLASTSNYVVWMPEIITIMRKYGLAGLSMLPPAVAATVQSSLEPVDYDPFAQ